MVQYTRISPERHEESSAERAGSLVEALAAIGIEFALSRFAAKERIDLAALAAASSPAAAAPALAARTTRVETQTSALARTTSPINLAIMEA